MSIICFPCRSPAHSAAVTITLQNHFSQTPEVFVILPDGETLNQAIMTLSQAEAEQVIISGVSSGRDGWSDREVVVVRSYGDIAVWRKTPPICNYDV